jgi:purine-cytosine permease-like protein
MLLWSLNALLGLATWYQVGYQLGYHGSWLICFALAAAFAGFGWGVIEVIRGSRATD